MSSQRIMEKCSEVHCANLDVYEHLVRKNIIVKVSNSDITNCDKIKVLGVTIDTQMNF